MPKEVEVKQAGAAKLAAFDPASLSTEQQELVVEEFLGYHPKYFIYSGLNVQLNFGRFEAEERRIAKATGEPRKAFNGWKPKGNRQW
jgi:hypothetical protein